MITITRPFLRTLRNDLPMPFVFEQLGTKAPYAKQTEGQFRFVCPHCNELLATLNPKNNMAHCFNCHNNINTIDLMMLLGYGFMDAVYFLDKWHQLFKQNKPQQKKIRSHKGPQTIAQILLDLEP